MAFSDSGTTSGAGIISIVWNTLKRKMSIHKKKKKGKSGYIQNTIGKPQNLNVSSVFKKHFSDFVKIVAIVSGIVAVFGFYLPISSKKILAVNSFDRGIELYRKHLYDEAITCFNQAIEARIDSYDNSSVEMASCYKMLGISIIESLTSDNDAAINAFLEVKRIYENSNMPYDVAYCYYYIARAYNEKGYIQLYFANENIWNCHEVLESIEELDKALKIPWLSLEYDDKNHSQIDYFIDLYNYRALYELCKYYRLLIDAECLLGEISLKTKDVEKAFAYFNRALGYSSRLSTLEYSLAVCNISERVTIRDKEIRNHIEEIAAFNQLENAMDINVYDLDEFPVNTEKYNSMLIFSAPEIATFLTNRAICEIGLKLSENAKKDCEIALDIWSKYDYQNQVNIALTYTNLAIATVISHDDVIDGEKVIEDRDSLLDLMNRAISYDLENYGPDSPKTASTYESRGFIYLLLNEIENSLESYYSAYLIYDENNDDAGAEFVKNRMREAFDFPEYEDSDTSELNFDEWWEKRIKK